MTLSLDAYTLAANQPLNHARILYAPIAGTVTASGTNGDLAANDFTAQQWAAAAGVSAWTMTPAAAAALDTVFVAGHNMAGKSIRAQIGGPSRTNLFTRSSEFNDAIWTKATATITANAAIAPDNTLTADKLVEDGTLAPHALQRSLTIVAGEEAALSLYVMAAERTKGRLRIVNGSDAFGVTFDLVAQTVASTEGGVGHLTFSDIVEDPDNGWSRIRIKGLLNGAATSGTVQINLADDAGLITYTGNGASGFYIWGAQAEQRVNLATFPNSFDNAIWNKSNATVTANAAIAPDGTLTADKLVENTSNAIHLVQQPRTILAGQMVEWAIYVQAAERTKGRIQVVSGNTDYFGADFDLTAQTITPITFGTGFTALYWKLHAVGGGWYRATVAGKAQKLIVSVAGRISLRNAIGASTYTGDGASGFYIWGGHLSQGDAVTSLIFTTTAAVTSDFHAVSPWVAMADNSAVAIMTNDADGDAWQATKYQIEIPDGTGSLVAIIRGGVALQMARPVYGGLAPIELSRTVEAVQGLSEGGQWLGVSIHRRALQSQMEWSNIPIDWYIANFKPFAEALPQTPFGVIQNPLRLPDSVAWCWTASRPPAPSLMGQLNHVSFALPMTGLLS